MTHNIFIGKLRYGEIYFINTRGENLTDERNAIKFISNNPILDLLDYLKGVYKKDQKAHLIGISEEITEENKERILRFIREQKLKITIEDHLQ